MNQKILFTPVGGTDPISNNNFRDGSMLHICRVYQPDRVIMYMSKEVLEKQEKDDQYRYCLRKLGELQGHTYQVEQIERRELTRVHEFDYFYPDFREIIGNIYRSMDESDTLYLNVSSGTPGMKSGLMVLQTMGEFPAKVIQVATPDRKMNEHTHKDYDVEIAWELDEDNQEGFENRCQEISCPSLSRIKKEEIIKKHVQAYDYRAALVVADTIEDVEELPYLGMIQVAAFRLALDFKEMDKKSKQIGYDCLPVKASSDRKYFEYALNLDVKLKKREYADFIRATTPLFVDLFEKILKKQCGVDVNDYCDIKVRNGQEKREWSEEKLKGTKYLDIFDREYKDRKNNKAFQYGSVYAVHLKVLIVALSQDDHLKKLVENVRHVEGELRNPAAHDIVSVTEEKVKSMTGFTARQIMDMTKELFTYTDIRVRKEYWDSYDQMNEDILRKML